MLKNVISISRRSDVPAFYMPWLLQAIERGFVEVENPFYPGQKRTVSLLPKDVAWMVLWSRHFGAFLKHRQQFEAYELFFNFTILSKSPLEPVMPARNKVIEQLEKLARIYGPQRINWRYDPLTFWQENRAEHTNYNRADFIELCRIMHANGVQRCYTSIAFPYRKYQRRLAKRFPQVQIQSPSIPRQIEILSEMAGIAKAHDITIFSCCNPQLLQVKGLQTGHCIDGNLLQKLVPHQKISLAKAPTREHCGCTKSIDIGSYRQQPCLFGCTYCYANPISYNS